MAQDFAGFDANDADDDDEYDFGALPDPEVARLVLELDRTIMRHRRGAALRRIVHGLPVPRPLQVPIKPSRVELRVLTALVLTYGPVLLGSDFGPVLDQFAECGAVDLLQQVVFGDPTGGEASKDSQNRRIAARLQDVRPMWRQCVASSPARSSRTRGPC
ncbi:MULTISPECIES: hypothetical protein [unclassified Caballeronia]|uniref:hypothetical protein n=1 Tax=unclassified Caballeronia TaxID=2646786 RepID=UPI00285FD359|nr:MULTISPECIES: hypothetical protein [unclassified Caballeronia]MDR5776307.1 hypothetical protein [Caballeronia sp. LZ002]MDR5851911.1 hypothetical protein [Caballeronia sp. LZ003]